MCTQSTLWKFQGFLSTSIYNLVLINVCHFHQVLLQSLFKFDHYRDTRAFILDPCIQGILTHKEAQIFDYQEFLHILKAYIYQLNKIHCPKIAKTAFLHF